jgi:hypothetical protein
MSDQMWIECVITTLLAKKHAYCSSRVEAEAIVESVAADCKDEMNGSVNNGAAAEVRIADKQVQVVWMKAFCDALGIADDECKGLMSDCIELYGKKMQKKHGAGAVVIKVNEDEDNTSNTPDDVDEVGDSVEITDYGDDSDGEWIGEGECELCERTIRLTAHHLIPKSTWARIEPRLRNARDAIESNNMVKAERILGDGLSYMIAQLSKEGVSIRRLMGRTCNICRPCHSTIHRTHDNMTLALNYSSVDLLMEDATIAKFSRWASKQRTGQYKLHETMKHTKPGKKV